MRVGLRACVRACERALVPWKILFETGLMSAIVVMLSQRVDYADTALQTFIGVASVCRFTQLSKPLSAFASVCRFPQLSKPLSALHQCAGFHSSPNLYRRCISVQVCGGETQISRNKRARCSNNTSFTAAKAAGNYKFYMQQQKPTSKPKGTENVTAANTARVQTTSLLFN